MKEYKLIEGDIEYTIHEYNNGNKYYIHNGLYHRKNGKAIENNNGGSYWLNGCKRRPPPEILPLPPKIENYPETRIMKDILYVFFIVCLVLGLIVYEYYSTLY